MSADSPPSSVQNDTAGGTEGLSPAEAARARAEVRSEVADYLITRSERRRLFPRAALVGLFAGLTAVTFRLVLDGSYIFWGREIDLLHRRTPWGFLLLLLVFPLGAVLAFLVAQRFAPETRGGGIPHIQAVLRRQTPLFWKRVLPVKYIGSILASGLGALALGPEGPCVQMGGAIGDGVAQRFGGTFRDRETLITAGAGAGLAAAFNAPLSGLVFVLEDMKRDFTPVIFGAALVASVIADLVARIVSGQEPVFRFPIYAPMPLSLMPAFIVLGALAGVLGVVYNRSLVGALNLFSQYQQRIPGWIIPALVGVVVAIVGWFAPNLLGGGHGLAEEALSGRIAFALVPLYFVTRLILTSISFGSGVSGGIFAPLLALGALLGLGVGYGVHALWPDLVPQIGVFVVVGMAAYFTATIRAPLTGIVLIVEMTGSYAQMVPLLAACFAAYAVAEGLGDEPINEVLLERLLSRGSEVPGIHEPQVLMLAVEHGAPFDGRRVRDLGLPPGCILVSIRRGFEDIVPVADTILSAEDRITAIVGPEAKQGVALLRHGVEE